MNLPNKLSMLRIFLIPVTMLFMLPISIYGFEPEGWNAFISSSGMLIAAIVFIIASLTDLADGKIARKYNLITNLGKFLDSLADKMLVIAILIAFVQLQRVSAWLLAIIILREFMVTGIRMLAAEKGVVMAAKMIGKIKTTTQMIAITYLMFEPTILKFTGSSYDYANYPVNAVTIVGDVLFFICVAMTIISGMDYLLKNLDYLKNAD
jgi:CDP-diacylglycerol--glycerol-3-phosphate 3-phosphatidyltransferase/cardiolipin synthase